MDGGWMNGSLLLQVFKYFEMFNKKDDEIETSGQWIIQMN